MECNAQVRRDHLVDDTVVQIRSSNPASLKKPLKVCLVPWVLGLIVQPCDATLAVVTWRQVEFVGEEAIDAGGVTKEFFQLLSHAIVDPSYGALCLSLCMLRPM